jgi:Ca2+-dependent lipid-binding protein
MEEVRQIKNILLGKGLHSQPGDESEEYILSLTIIAARDLPNMDLLQGTDSYCVVLVDDLHDQVYQTRVIPHDNHPMWDANFEWVVPVEAQLITIAVLDKDTLTDDDLVCYHACVEHCTLLMQLITFVQLTVTASPSAAYLPSLHKKTKCHL